MAELIQNNSVIENAWEIVAKDSEYPAQAVNEGKLLILPLALWQKNQSQVEGKHTVGIWLDGDDSADILADQCHSLSLIAINFASFADGRGYSLARQLRDQFGYQGELRAIGDILKDQMFFYQRVGFNSFALRDDRPAEQALESLSDFNHVYQAAADDRPPVNSKR